VWPRVLVSLAVTCASVGVYPLGLPGVDVAPVAVAAAQDGCGIDPITTSILGEDPVGYAAWTAPGVYSTGLLSTAGTAAAGSTGVTAAVGAGGTATAAVGVFLAAFVGTCKFLDWATSDGMNDTEPYVPVTTTTSDLQECSIGTTYSAPGGTLSSLSGFWTAEKCVVINAGAVSDDFGIPWSTSWGEYENAGVNLPRPSSPEYPTHTTGTIYEHLLVHGALCGNGTACGIPYWSPGSDVVFTVECGSNVGGVCGVHPQWMVGFPRLSLNHQQGWQSFSILSPTAREKGWARYVVTQAVCALPGGGSPEFVQAVSEPFWDRVLSERVEVPTCTPGKIPQSVRVDTYPIGVEIDLDSPFRRPVTQITFPEAWFEPGPPPYVYCLTDTCAAPVTTGGTCTYGGGTLDGPCGPTIDDLPVGLPVEVPINPNPQTPAPGTPATTAPPTTTEPPPGGGSAVFPINVDGADEECLPAGWGWLNPITWVLDPIKCAARWLFVPDDDAMADAMSGLRDSLYGTDIGANVLGGVEHVTDTEVSFARWSDAGPDCVTLFAGTPRSKEICPREWDSGTDVVPPILWQFTMSLLWIQLIVVVWRFF
jgi:hypothetical protein